MPTSPSGTGQIKDLQRIARRAMTERGLAPDFPAAALDQLERISAEADAAGGSAQAAAAAKEGPALADLRQLPWCSIDNDDSRDLDQLSACEELPGGAVRILV